MTGKDGSPRIVDEAGTYTAKFRDGEGIVCEVSTGCCDEDAARTILSKLERRAELVNSEVMSKGESAMADHQTTPIATQFAAYLNHVRAKGVTAAHVADLNRKAKRLFAECRLGTLRDIVAELHQTLANRVKLGRLLSSRRTILMKDRRDERTTKTA